MPNQIDSMGLQVKSVTDEVTDITTDLQGVYGSDINVDPSSPDGQAINIFAQAVADALELLSTLNALFSADAAFGVMLDQNLGINGITRKGGTYTIQNVVVTVDRALALVGLDGNETPVGNEFVVADDAGTQFILVASQAPAGAGDYTYAFRAKNTGKTETLPNTIVNVITVTLGVTGVINPAAATSTGEDEETDSEVKIRRARSFFLAASGPADAVAAGILSGVTGITDVFVEENFSGSALSDGLPAHSIWVVAEGGMDADVADMIYKKRGNGCGMWGSTTVVITRPNSQSITITFDRPITQFLYVKFGLVAKNGTDLFDDDLLKQELVAALPWRINQQATIGDIVTAMAILAPNGYLTGCQVSKDNITYFDVVSVSDVQHKFELATDRITIT